VSKLNLANLMRRLALQLEARLLGFYQLQFAFPRSLFCALGREIYSILAPEEKLFMRQLNSRISSGGQTLRRPNHVDSSRSLAQT